MSAKQKFSYESDESVKPDEPATKRAGDASVPADAAKTKPEKKKFSASKDKAAENKDKAAEQNSKAAEESEKKSGSAKEKPAKKDKNPDGPKVKRSAWLVAAASLVVVVIIIGSLGLTGIVNVSGLLSELGIGRGSGSTYAVENRDALLIYLAHPSLTSGDTLNLTSSYIVDVDTDFDGFAQLPLVNFVGSGSITFTGGIVFMSGDEPNVDLSKASFNNTTLYIEAPDSSITSSSIPDTYINAKKLNGSAHLKDLELAFPGTRMNVPVIFTNNTSSNLENVKISLSSPSFIFGDGDSYILASIPANGTVTHDIPVVATEAGRLSIFAYAVDETGNLLVSGKSDFVNIFGPGYYSGDLHTHTDFSRSIRYGTIPGNIQAGYDHGLSFIVSVENELEAEQYTQEMVDKVTGDPGIIQQYTGYELGPHNRHLLIYNTDLRPSSSFGEIIDGYGIWTYQAAINEVLAANGIAVMAHLYDHGDITEAINLSKSSRGAHVETLCNTHKYSEMDVQTECALNVWNGLNVSGDRVYGIMSSNNIYPEDVGMRFVKGYMANLVEANLYKYLFNGNFFSSNGPELRFELGGFQMGQELIWGVPMIQDPEAPPAAEGEEPAMIADPDAAPSTATATIHASDIYPLTTIRLIKYEITNVLDSENGILVYEEDLTGKNIYNYYNEIEVELGSREFIRLEVLSEQARYYDDIGVALSNPIWITAGQKDNYATIGSISNILGTDVQTAPNGALYINSNLGIIPGLLNVNHNGQKVTVIYNRFNSDTLVDYVTVDVLTEAGTHTVKKIYLV